MEWSGVVLCVCVFFSNVSMGFRGSCGRLNRIASCSFFLFQCMRIFAVSSQVLEILMKELPFIRLCETQ